MRELPILMSTPMVQAIQDGEKTQTRREIKADEQGRVCKGRYCINFHPKRGLVWIPYSGAPLQEYPNPEDYCPYGKPGDLLWVRETFAWEIHPDTDEWVPIFRADVSRTELEKHYKWKPSIFMPKKAARMWLKVTDVRVERVQDITEEDAMSEGVSEFAMYSTEPALDCFERLWRNINGGQSWEDNHYVWVVDFEVVSKNGRP